MHLTPEELDLIRQWFNAVDDLAPSYLEPADRELARKIHAAINVPFSERANGQVAASAKED